VPYRRLRKVALKGETKDGIEGKLINTRKEKKRGKLSNVNSASKQRVIVDLKSRRGVEISVKGVRMYVFYSSAFNCLLAMLNNVLRKIVIS